MSFDPAAASGIGELKSPAPQRPDVEAPEQPSLDFSPSENDRAVLERVLRAFWSTTPEAAGVMLLDDAGHPLAYDLVHTEDAAALARTALAQRAVALGHGARYGPATPSGTLVTVEHGRVLVVFLPDGYADEFPRIEIPEGIAA